jgi:hypothetical protein
VKILVAVAIVLLASSVRAQESDVDPRMQRVEDWLKAILHHQPGEFDDAAERMARWSYVELQALSIDAVALSQLMRDAMPRRCSAARLRSRPSTSKRDCGSAGSSCEAGLLRGLTP